MYTKTQQQYVGLGNELNARLIKIVQRAIGVTKRQVEAKKNTIISGPPGVGKTHTTAEEIKQSGKPWVSFGPGATETAIAAKLAYEVRKLQGTEKELVVLIDDADDIIFKDKRSMNQWKLTLAKDNPEYKRDVDLTTQISKLRKQNKDAVADAIEYWMEEGEVGISIPMDQVRFVVLCNKNYEDERTVHKSKRDDVEALIDRVRYTRLEFEWKVAWGWLAYILTTTQPFEDDGVHLNKTQKERITKWMWDKWEIRSFCVLFK